MTICHLTTVAEDYATILTQEKHSGRPNSLPACFWFCASRQPPAWQPASVSWTNSFKSVCLQLKLILSNYNSSHCYWWFISETILGIYWIYLDSCLSTDSNSICLNHLFYSILFYLSKSMWWLDLGPMASMAYGIPIEPSIHESIQSIHLLLKVNLTFWVLAWTLAPLSLSLPRLRPCCLHWCNSAWERLTSSQWKLNTPTVCVFPGGLACLAVVYFHTTRTSRSFCLSDLSLALLADLLGHKIYIYIHLQHDEWPVAASEQWPVTTDHSIEWKTQTHINILY